MTIDNAIEVLEQFRDEGSEDLPLDVEPAINLGIEGLKRLKEHREDHIDITFRALPGETKG